MKVLAIHSGALGDLVLFGRLCRLLGGKVTLVAKRAVGRLLAGMGVVARAIDFESLPMHEVFHDKPLDECLLPGLLGGYDRMVSCFAAGETVSEVRLAMLAGVDSAAFLPVRPAAAFDGHVVELWCDLLGSSKFVVRSSKSKTVAIRNGKRRGTLASATGSIRNGNDKSTQRRAAVLHEAGKNGLADEAWTVPDGWLADALAVLKAAGLAGEYAVIHPGSGGAAKCWSAERFVELARRWRGQGLAAVFVLGPAEIERWRPGQVEEIRREFTLIENPSLEVLAGLLAGGLMYVGNDSGVSHLAGAVGARSLVIFGPSDPRHFRPLGPGVKILHPLSLEKLTVDEVVKAAG